MRPAPHSITIHRPYRVPCGLARLLTAVLVAGIFHCPAGADEKSTNRPGASVESAILLVQNTTARILAAMSRDRDRIATEPEQAFDTVARIVLPSIDLERTSRLVLGDHWTSATDKQRTRFKQVFADQLIRTYVLGLSDYLAVSDKIGVAIDYLPGMISNNGKVAVVRTRVGAASMAVGIDYRLYLFEDGWRVFDVLVEGVSVASTYRSSFRSEASRNGMDRLIERIAEKNRRLGPA